MAEPQAAMDDFLHGGQVSDMTAEIAALKKQMRELLVASSTPPSNILLNDTGVHQISNTAVETIGNTVTIPAGILGATGMILFECCGYVANNSGSGKQIDIKIYFGATAITVWSNTINNTDTETWWCQVMIKNLTAGAQRYQYQISRILSGAGYAKAGTGTLAIDTTLAVTAKNTHKWDAASANAISNIWWGRVEYQLAI